VIRLLELKANVDAIDSAGNAPLHLAMHQVGGWCVCTCVHCVSHTQSRRDVARALLARDADPLRKNARVHACGGCVRVTVSV
jgi:hypothetical protein